MEDNFYHKLLVFLFESMKNNHTDNYDFHRFGKRKKEKFSLKRFLKEKFISPKYVGNLEFNPIKETVDLLFKKYASGFESLYNILSDTHSRETLVKVIAYKIFGPKFVKLPLNTPDYWKNLEEIEKIADKSRVINPNFKHFMLYYFDLNKLNIPILIYYSALGVLIEFIAEQYRYKNDTIITAEPGDIVIDAGACWGDTALYFANKVGNNGRVYSFEFLNENLMIFNTNIGLNENLKPIITLVEKPLWAESDVLLDISAGGPGSSVSLGDKSSSQYKSISIDDFVSQNHIPRVDFIKMDIEGAELQALKGAEKTIRMYKPKLAIAIYHSLEDFVSIPQWISNLDLGYKLYLDHYTIHNEETVIYAKVG